MLPRSENTDNYRRTTTSLGGSKKYSKENTGINTHNYLLKEKY
jgi:hypothetical protein